MTAVATPERTTTGVTVAHRRRIRWGRVGLYTFLTVMAVVWLFPLAWAVYTALRPFSDTQARGYISLPGTLNFDNTYTRAADVTTTFPAQNIGLSLAALMLGIPTSTSIADNNGFDISNNWFGTFVQEGTAMLAEGGGSFSRAVIRASSACSSRQSWSPQSWTRSLFSSCVRPT